MIISSHKLRTEEKKLYHKLIATFIFFLIGFFLFIYAGLPLFAKITATLTLLRRETPITETSQKFPLFPPVLNPLSEATNSSYIKVSGYGENEATIKILVNDKEAAKVLADKEGKFLSSRLLLSEGINTITALTTKDQQESSPSAPLSITYKKTLPKLEITSPSENEKFSGETKEITIKGETDPGNRVTINDRFVIVDQNGKFNKMVTLTEGENKFKITAVDLAGNQTTVERKVTYNPF